MILSSMFLSRLTLGRKSLESRAMSYKVPEAEQKARERRYRSAIVKSKTRKAAAEALGVSLVTIQRWVRRLELRK